VDEVYSAPVHPYTQALLSAIPIPDPKTERSRQRIVLSGDLPSPADPPSGCKFRTRCFKYAALTEADKVKCRDVVPLLKPYAVDHTAACHYGSHAEGVAVGQAQFVSRS